MDRSELDANARKNLQNTLKRICMESQKLNLTKDQKKLKYKGTVQESRLDKLVVNQTIYGNWEYTLRDLVENVHTGLLEKLSFGNHLDIKHFKNNLKTSKHAVMVRKEEDWMLMACMLAVESEMEKGNNLEESLLEVAKYRERSYKYNWTTKDINKIFDMTIASDTKTATTPKKRPRGKKSKDHTQSSLQKAKARGIKLIVDGRNLLKTEEKSLERRKVIWGIQEAKHLETQGNITRMMEQDTKLKVTTFTKDISTDLKDIMDRELLIHKRQATEAIQNKNTKGEDLTQSRVQEKRQQMQAASVCYNKCNLCKHFAKIDIVLQESSKMGHYNSFHEAHMKEPNQDLMKSYYPVVKIIRK